MSKLGRTPPGEIPSRRRIVLADVLLLARRYGVPLEGPPAHPFNSLWALRSVQALGDCGQRRALAERYFRAAWAEGRRLDDPAVLRACLAELGVDQDPELVATTAEQRRALKANTQELLDLGGFGVPTFVTGDLLFFGHDRLSLLADYAEGSLELDRAKLEAMLARPQPGRVEA